MYLGTGSFAEVKLAFRINDIDMRKPQTPKLKTFCGTRFYMALEMWIWNEDAEELETQRRVDGGQSRAYTTNDFIRIST